MDSSRALAHPHIVGQEDLRKMLAAWRAAGKRIVFTNGCYDILHPGHVNLLARARALGDVLVLGVNSDESVRRLGKGEDRPLNPFPVRAYVLAHLASVDAVIRFDENTPLRLIEFVQPDVLVKGGDWSVERIVGREPVEAAGGKVVSLPLLGDYSTTALVKRIRESEGIERKCGGEKR